MYLYRDKSADLKRKAFDCCSVQVRASSSLFLSNLCLIYICTGSISHLIVKSCPQIAIFAFFQFRYKLKTVSHLADVGVSEFLRFFVFSCAVYYDFNILCLKNFPKCKGIIEIDWTAHELLLCLGTYFELEKYLLIEN